MNQRGVDTTGYCTYTVFLSIMKPYRTQMSLYSGALSHTVGHMVLFQVLVISNWRVLLKLCFQEFTFQAAYPHPEICSSSTE